MRFENVSDGLFELLNACGVDFIFINPGTGLRRFWNPSPNLRPRDTGRPNWSCAFTSPWLWLLPTDTSWSAASLRSFWCM